MKHAFLLSLVMTWQIVCNSETSPACGSSEFTCQNGDCIAISFVCNGITDCNTSEDELDCSTDEPSPSSAPSEIDAPSETDAPSPSSAPSETDAPSPSETDAPSPSETDAPSPSSVHSPASTHSPASAPSPIVTKRPCDILINGRVGFNDGINGVYVYSGGKWEGFAYYIHEGPFLRLFLFAYGSAEGEYWLISEELGGDDAFALVFRNGRAVTPDLIRREDWLVYHDEDWETDRNVRAACNEDTVRECASSDFICRNSDCVARAWVCDGIKDCSTSEDELDCPTDESSSSRKGPETDEPSPITGCTSFALSVVTSYCAPLVCSMPKLIPDSRVVIEDDGQITACRCADDQIISQARCSDIFRCPAICRVLRFSRLSGDNVQVLNTDYVFQGLYDSSLLYQKSDRADIYLWRSCRHSSWVITSEPGDLGVLAAFSSSDALQPEHVTEPWKVFEGVDYIDDFNLKVDCVERQ